ncbi:hypothetical protein KCP75_02470 [Salmonella enterica subsp. enterica]|nr:hypothetical protein KCP75_02470 [Salmonella enterica subsp. enterica]
MACKALSISLDAAVASGHVKASESGTARGAVAGMSLIWRFRSRSALGVDPLGGSVLNTGNVSLSITNLT